MKPGKSGTARSRADQASIDSIHAILLSLTPGKSPELPAAQVAAQDAACVVPAIASLVKAVASLTETVAALHKQTGASETGPATGELIPLTPERHASQIDAARATVRAVRNSLPRERIPRSVALEAAMIHAANAGKTSQMLDAWLMHEVGKDYE